MCNNDYNLLANAYANGIAKYNQELRGKIPIKKADKSQYDISFSDREPCESRRSDDH